MYNTTKCKRVKSILHKKKINNNNDVSPVFCSKNNSNLALKNDYNIP